MIHLLRNICVILALVVFAAAISEAEAADKVTKCRSVWQQIGDSWIGGMAGFKPEKNQCFKGGGKQFCADASDPKFSNEFECAGAHLSSPNDDEAEKLEEWPDFDFTPPKPVPSWEEMTAEERNEYNREVAELERKYHKITTRDNERGRAGKGEENGVLYMNEFDICRVINNTTTSLPSVFMGVKTYDEWETVHGVKEGGDKNGGFKGHMAGDPDLPPMKVCCRPQMVEICGDRFSTGYVTVGETIMMSAGDGYAEVTCVSNNHLRVSDVDGVCGEDNGQGYHNPSPKGGNDKVGYKNHSTGGTISESDAKKYGVPAGYNKTTNVATNEEGLRAQGRLAEDNVDEQEDLAEEALDAWEEELKKMEEEARKAEEEARRKDGYGNN